MHFNPRFSKWIFPWTALFLTLLMGMPMPCQADEPPVYALQWKRGQGATACPDQQKLAREVAARLGRDPFADHAPRQIIGSIERNNGLFSLQLNEQGPISNTAPLTQTSSSPDCDAIFAYAVVAVSMIIAPEALAPIPSSSIPPMEQEPCTPPAPHPLPSEKPVPPRPMPPPVIQIISPPPPLHLSLFIQGGILQGVLPGITPQWGIEARVGRHRFEASLSLFQTTVRQSDNGAFALQNHGGSLGLCVRAIDLARVSFWGCGHAWLGIITLDLLAPKGFIWKNDGPFPWFGTSLAPRLRLALPLSLRIEGGAHVLFNMPPLGFTSDTTQGDTFYIYTQDQINIAPFISLGISIL